MLFGKNSVGERARQLFVLFIGWFIPVLFWLLRNYALLGYLFFHTLPGGHFLHLSAARVAMHVHNTSYQEARVRLQHEVDQKIHQQEQQWGRSLNEIEQCYAHEFVAKKYFKMKPLLALKNWLTDIVRASLSLYSAEIVYLESGRAEYDYFKKNRPWWSLFERYLFLRTDNVYIKSLVYAEIGIFLLILLGFAGSVIRYAYMIFCKQFTLDIVFFIESGLFICFFLLIALAGGYARMRLSVEPFLLLYSLLFWRSVCNKVTEK